MRARRSRSAASPTLTSSTMQAASQGASLPRLFNAVSSLITGAKTARHSAGHAGPASCPSGWKCAFFTVNNALTGNQDRDIVDCTVAGAGTQGAACSTDATCAANFLCSTVGTATACRRVCNLTTGGNECAAIPGTTCGGFNPALVVGGATYGICR